MPTAFSRRTALLVALLLAALPGLALAQGAPRIDLALESFGVGGRARAGEWAGVCVKIVDRAVAERQVILRLHLRDPDGDRPVYEREYVTNPTADRRDGETVWLYARLPYWHSSGDPVTITAHEAREQGGRFVAGEQIGRAEFPVHSIADARLSLILVVGRADAGLSQYAARLSSTDPWSPGGHEGTDVISGVTPQSLPNQWQGLMAFDAIVWTNTVVAQLRDAPGRAEAIKEWVRRGGHLVVVIPANDPASWPGNPATNDLHDILPIVTKTTREAADLEPFRPLFVSPRRSAPPSPDEPERAITMPAGVAVHTFSPREARPADAIPILSGPDGPFVVRRLVGAGAVTLVGIDLGSPRFRQHGLPDAEQFWDRVLGRRGMLFDAQEMNAQNPNSQFSRLANRGHAAAVLDRFIGQLIDKKGTAVAGVTLGFVVFLLYWLLAAPVAFAVLKRRNLTQHSWVVFLAAAGVFTGIAWGGATLLRPSRISGAHVTLLDHVYGQDRQRARSWFSLLIPWYGDATVTLREPQPDRDADPTSHLLAPWDRYKGSAGGGFPDAREYPIDARHPDSLTFPTRSTIKEFQADWSGGPRWAMPFPEGDDSAAPIRALPRPQSGELIPSLLGTLRHDLPGPLEHVLVVLVRGPKPLTASSGQLLADAEYWWRREPWAPQEPLELAELTKRTEDTRGIDRRAEAMLESMASIIQPDAERLGGNADDLLTALAFLNQFQPPPLDNSKVFPPVQRAASHGYDLGIWFTQPSVIVVGILGGREPAECPVPIFVGDAGSTPRKVNVLGKTVVRWVYPLPPSPVRPSSSHSALDAPTESATPSPPQ